MFSIFASRCAMGKDENSKQRLVWWEQSRNSEIAGWKKISSTRSPGSSFLPIEEGGLRFCSQHSFRMNGGPNLQKGLALRRHRGLQGILGSLESRIWPIQSHKEPLTKCRWERAAHRKWVHPKPMVGALSRPLICLSHGPTTRAWPHPTSASDRWIGQDTSTARYDESHRTVEEWKSCMNWWHPTRDLEKWKTSAQYQAPRILPLGAGSREISHTMSSSPDCSTYRGMTLLP